MKSFFSKTVGRVWDFSRRHFVHLLTLPLFWVKPRSLSQFPTGSFQTYDFCSPLSFAIFQRSCHLLDLSVSFSSSDMQPLPCRLFIVKLVDKSLSPRGSSFTQTLPRSTRPFLPLVAVQVVKPSPFSPVGAGRERM